MNEIMIKEAYHKYLLDYLKINFDEFIEAELLSFQEYKEKYKEMDVGKLS